MSSFKCEPIVIACLQRTNNNIELARRYLEDDMLVELMPFVNDENYIPPGTC